MSDPGNTLSSEQLKLNIEYLPVEELIPYVNNPKTHPPHQVDKIASSIKNFGFIVPIILDDENEIVAGHGRILASQKLGLSEVPCIRVEHLTPAQVKAFRIADNKTAESEWDTELLAINLEELEAEGIDITLTGFDVDEIDDLLGDIGPDIEEDDYDPEPVLEEEEYKIMPGDLIILGPHRLYCGDAKDKVSYEQLLGSDFADMIFTDPPYNVDYEGGTADKLKIDNDDMSESDFYNFLYDFYVTAIEFVEEGTPIYVCCSEEEAVNFRQAMVDAGWRKRQCLIWVKNTFVLGRQDYHWKHEPIIYGWKPGAAHKWYGGRREPTVIQDSSGVTVRKTEDGQYLIAVDTGVTNLTIKVPDYEVEYQGDDEYLDTWFFDRPLRNDMHPTMKPIGLVARAVKNSSRRNELVLDPFSGAGSTLVACEQIGRRARLVELDPAFCDVTMDRFVNFRDSTEDVRVVRGDEELKHEEL